MGVNDASSSIDARQSIHKQHQSDEDKKKTKKKEEIKQADISRSVDAIAATHLLDLECDGGNKDAMRNGN